MGINFSDTKPIKGLWKFTVSDNNYYPITLEFDLVYGRSPLILGLYEAQYYETYHRNAPLTINIKRLQDIRAYTMHTYTADDDNWKNRQGLQIVPHLSSLIHTLITTTDRHRELSMANLIYRFGHVSSS